MALEDNFSLVYKLYAGTKTSIMENGVIKFDAQESLIRRDVVCRIYVLVTNGNYYIL